jgi:hypothetical protein
MPSRIFSIPEFDRFARKSRIIDEQLVDAVDRADGGLVYADLGEGVIKQAVARPNESARRGFRTIVGFKMDTRAFFFFGFAKNEADTITDNALKDFRARTASLMDLPDVVIAMLLNEGELREIERPLPIEVGDEPADDEDRVDEVH